MFDQAIQSPWRFFLATAVLAAILCLFPAKVDAPEQAVVRQETQAPVQERPVGADLSERTGSSCYLHTTLYFAPCGHTVQGRDRLPAGLVGLSRAAFEEALEKAMPGAAVTGFSQDEVDIARSVQIPCPLHWVLRTGEDGMLHVLQNRDGESLSVVRRTDVSAAGMSAQETAALLEGKVFDDVQALEGYLEGISS